MPLVARCAWSLFHLCLTVGSIIARNRLMFASMLRTDSEYIREMRLDAVEELLEVNREELANLHGWCKNNLEYMEPGGDEVFSLMEMAAKQWTSSGVSAEEYPGSATELVDVVPDYQEEVERTFRAPADAFFFNQPSVICSRAGSRCWRILEDMPSSTKRHRRHMAKQAAK